MHWPSLSWYVLLKPMHLHCAEPVFDTADAEHISQPVLPASDEKVFATHA